MLLVAVAPGSAQAQLSVSADGTYNNNILNGSWGLGGRIGVELPRTRYFRWDLVGGAVWYFPSCGGGTCDWWEAQGMLLFYRPAGSEFDPYFGAGFSYHTFKLVAATVDDTDWGIDLLLGSKLGMWGPVQPYAEVRYKFMNEVPANQFAFTFGVRLGR